MWKVLAALGLVASLGSGGFALFRDSLPPAPQQPIAFDHRVHAGRMAIGCTACHVYAERGPVAGIPSMARCKGCHRFVKEDRDDPVVDAQLQALGAQLKLEAPIEWVRVHRLPDHVRFTHQRHVLSGVACRECHGAVEEMQAVRQVSPLSMGWCLECHRQKQAAKPVALARLTDCTTCHK
jgi:hypothetical protein